jgi:hypothetical protein
MKGFLLAVSIFLQATALCQQAAQPVVSLAGIGAIKLGMKKEALDKLLSTPVKLKNLLLQEWSPDTVQVQQGGVDYSVVFNKSIDEQNRGAIVIYAVHSRSPLLKTRSGVAIGDDKLKIVSTYDDFMLHLAPEYDETTGAKIKGKSSVMLYDDETPAMIVFDLEEGKVAGFWVAYAEGC